VNATNAPDLSGIRRQLAELRTEITKVVIGQDQVLEHMIVTILCGGHALLEGVPGTAKTLAVRALSLALACQSKRIQFTPDLMPSDILGTNVFDAGQQRFELRRGPIFTDLLLADEINRAPAKTQSALLEGMSESHATIDGVRHELSPIFTVFATQNPVEFEGTYPLPEAQQDRFLVKIRIDYPQADAEMAVLDRVDCGQPPDRLGPGTLRQILNPAQMIAARAGLSAVRVEPGVKAYLLEIVRATRGHEAVLVGAGPRGSIFLLLASKARAVLHGRDFVTPDDVVAMVGPVLGHRVTLAADAEISGTTTSEILQSILDRVDVPR
jgi:MoxR-like ATPase